MGACPLHLSGAAQAELARRCETRHKSLVRILALGGGAGGAGFGLTLSDTALGTDTLFDCGELTLCIDSAALNLFEGVSLDYDDQDGGAFVFLEAAVRP